MKQLNRAISISLFAIGSLIIPSGLQARRGIFPRQPIDKTSPEYLEALAFEKQLQQDHLVMSIPGSGLTIEATRQPFPNFEVSTGTTNISGFAPNSLAAGIRDSHFNDVYNGTAAWAWTDNSTVTGSNTLNAMVAVGTVNPDGSVVINHVTNLTGFTTQNNTTAWDTAVAIDRTNPNNITVSWGLISTGLPYRAYSTDSGATWTAGLMNVQPTGSPPAFGDNRGVAADKFGNIWYLSTNAYNSSSYYIGQPYFAVSSNGGNTFTLAYTVPLLPDFVLNESFYDYPQYCFGGLGDGSGTYGLWYVIDYFATGKNNPITPVVGFIPITGLGSFGTGTVYELSSFTGTQEIPSLCASANGRVWAECFNLSGEQVVAMRYKSPGAIGANYFGPFLITDLGFEWFLGPGEDSYPDTVVSNNGYFTISVQADIYDEVRQALYALGTTQVPDEYGEQNMEINFYISRNNGQTWTSIGNIANTTSANRGFSSMALDTATGDLVFGFYDGRVDTSNYQEIQYYGAVITSTTLDTLANSVQGALPSYPIYPIPF